MGHPTEDCVLASIGDRVKITKNKISIAGHVSTGTLMVDGLGVGDVDGALLDVRRKFAMSGIVVVTIFLNEKTKEVKRVEIEAKGVLDFSQHKSLFEKSEIVLRDSLRAVKETDFIEYPTLKEKAEEKMSGLFWKHLRRQPYILTNVYEI
jgi:ribonuclease J